MYTSSSNERALPIRSSCSGSVSNAPIASCRIRGSPHGPSVLSPMNVGLVTFHISIAPSAVTTAERPPTSKTAIGFSRPLASVYLLTCFATFELGAPLVVSLCDTACMRRSSKTDTSAEASPNQEQRAVSPISQYLAEIGRKGGLKGGIARRNALSAKKRKEIASKAAAA